MLSKFFIERPVFTTVISGDEAVTFVLVEPLHCALNSVRHAFSCMNQIVVLKICISIASGDKAQDSSLGCASSHWN